MALSARDQPAHEAAPGWVRRPRESRAEYEARLQVIRDLAGAALARLMRHAVQRPGRTRVGG